MADYVYLLETRLSGAQQGALQTVRDAAREQGLTVFLVGGAVRDLISGSPVRDLDFAVQGNALKLRKALEGAGARFSGEVPARQALFMRFPNGVRVEVSSTTAVSYAKPGKPEFTSVTILEDLRRRDFTANAMALSLNEGSYGLLMDPLNGVADIENRELRLVNNYGFYEDPVRMVRAARLMAREGWQLDERTRARYETGKDEGYIRSMQPVERDYELEELFHEEDPLRVMRRLEDEGWLKELSPLMSTAKANTVEMGKLHEAQMQLQTHGVLADAAAANFLLLTGKSSEAERGELMKRFPRVGFVDEIRTMEADAKEFASRLTSKEMAVASKAFVFIRGAHPATVLWTLYSSRSGAVQGKLKSFLNEWQQAPTKVPYALLAEMRITPDLPEYGALLERLTFALMDGQLGTAEEMKAFLEPYSPPAPPPPPSLRRAKAKKETKSAKSRKKAAPVDDAASVAVASAEPEEARVAEPAPVPVPPEAPETAEPAAGKVVRASTIAPVTAEIEPEIRPDVRDTKRPASKKNLVKPDASPEPASIKKASAPKQSPAQAKTAPVSAKTVAKNKADRSGTVARVEPKRPPKPAQRKTANVVKAQQKPGKPAAGRTTSGKSSVVAKAAKQAHAGRGGSPAKAAVNTKSAVKKAPVAKKSTPVKAIGKRADQAKAAPKKSVATNRVAGKKAARVVAKKSSVPAATRGGTRTKKPAGKRR